MSDLHLETSQQYHSFDFPATAPDLILGGDVGRLVDYDGYLAFLQRHADRYRRVFLVLGNHEFYGTSYPGGVETARRLESEPSLGGRVTLLHRGRYDLDLDNDSDTVTILGCVLWSRTAEEWSQRISRGINDFRCIRDWNLESHNAAHAEDVKWLTAELGRIRNEDANRKYPRRLIIVTHHAPLLRGTGWPSHEGSPLQSAFATDLCTGATWNSAKYWIFGHTHWTTDLTARNGVRLVSNQRGYVMPGDTSRRKMMLLPTEHMFDALRFIQL